MNHKLTLSLATATVLGLASSFAQDERKPEPPTPPAPPSGQERPPLPPGELRGRPRDPERAEQPPRGPEDRGPGDRLPGDRPGRLFGQRLREGGDRGPGFPPGDRRPDGPGPRGPGFDSDRDVRRESVERPRKATPYLGVVSVPAPPVLTAQLGLAEGFGLVVEDVLPDSPAKAAGIQRYDLLKLLNDQQLVSPDQLSRLVRGAGKDTEVTLTIIRKGQEQKLAIKVGEKMLPERAEFGVESGMGFPLFRGFGSASPEQLEQIEQMRRRMEEMGGRQGEAMRGMQERLRAVQERIQAYQEALRKYREKLMEWQKNPSGEPPQVPPMPEPPGGPGGPDQPGRPPQSDVRPADLLRELRWGADSDGRREWASGSSRWDPSRARATMRDPDGELELGIKEGHRVLTMKSPQGEVIFSGPVDTPEQRDAIPEKVRAKLPMLAPPPLPPGAASQLVPRPTIVTERIDRSSQEDANVQ